MNNQPLSPEKVSMLTTPRKGQRGRDIGIYAILILLVVGEVHMLHRISEIRGYVDQRDSQVQTNLQSGFQRKLAAENATQNAALETATRRIERRFLQMEAGTRKAQSDANRAAQRIERMQTAEDAALSSIQEMLAQKASASDLAALGHQVAQTRTEIDRTGTEISRLHAEVGRLQTATGRQIAGLNKQLASVRGQSPRFYSFRLMRNHPQTVNGVAMVLTRTRPKKGHYDLRLTVGDAHLERKNANSGEPIFFVPGSPGRTYEVVVNRVERGEVQGFLGTSAEIPRLGSAR